MFTRTLIIYKIKQEIHLCINHTEIAPSEFSHSGKNIEATLCTKAFHFRFYSHEYSSSTNTISVKVKEGTEAAPLYCHSVHSLTTLISYIHSLSHRVHRDWHFLVVVLVQLNRGFPFYPGDKISSNLTVMFKWVWLWELQQLLSESVCYSTGVVMKRKLLRQSELITEPVRA